MKRVCLFSALILLAFLSSCTVTQSVTFDKGQAETRGDATSSIGASNFLVSVLEDLSCWTGTSENNAFLDVAITGIANSIARSDYSRYVYISKTDENKYEITYGFSDFEKLVTQMTGNANQNILTLTGNGDTTTLAFYLSMENYDSLKAMIPLLSDPNFEAYGPVYNNPPYDFRTEDDYIYMMEFIFGEGAEEIAYSTVSIAVNTPKSIISTSGEKISDTCTVFSFRLIDFLLLHEPITFSCTY